MHGVGYRLFMTTRSLAGLPADGDEVTVHTHLHVREGEMTLFGFESTGERDAFEALLGVSGVGPKVALATLSALSPDELANAVATEDLAVVSSVPGVGKKTAQRIIVDLADKLGPAVSGHSSTRARTAGAPLAEAREALMGMGFTTSEVAAALKGAPADTDAQAAIRYALSRIGGGR